LHTSENKTFSIDFRDIAYSNQVFGYFQKNILVIVSLLA